MNTKPIGIIDSGIGGFSVAKAIKSRLPQEDILYLGDGANAPYGNRSSEELTALASYMVDFMNKQQVKLLLIACNTISCLASTYEKEIASPVLYVAKSGALGVAKQNYSKIGVISTNFTHQKEMYKQHIHQLHPEKEVFSQGSTHLVQLIERNQGDKESSQLIQKEIHSVLTPLLADGIQVCVLGCTHYPLVLKEFVTCYPNLPFSDPASEMAQEAEQLLSDNNLLNYSGGKLSVFTTGATELQEEHLKRANLFPATEIRHHTPLDLSKPLN